MVFTAVSESRIVFKHLEVNRDKEVNETDVANATLKFDEIGPSFDLICRRDKMGASDLFKKALK